MFSRLTLTSPAALWPDSSTGHTEFTPALPVAGVIQWKTDFCPRDSRSFYKLGQSTQESEAPPSPHPRNWKGGRLPLLFPPRFHLYLFVWLAGFLILQMIFSYLFWRHFISWSRGDRKPLLLMLIFQKGGSQNVFLLRDVSQVLEKAFLSQKA